MALHGHNTGHNKGIGRDHPASQTVPNSSKAGRSPFGRDFPEVGRFPSGGKMPTGPRGRDHPASKGPEVPPTTDPFGRE